MKETEIIPNETQDEIQDKTNKDWMQHSLDNVADRKELIKEIAESRTAPSDPIPEPKSASCQWIRPNKETCLQEFDHAQENPRTFSPEQLKAINDLNNICPFCAKSLESQE